MTRWSRVFLCFVALFAFGSAQAQTALDLGAMLKEGQQVKRHGDKMTIVMWFPDEYWSTSFNTYGNIDRKVAETILSELRQYVILFVFEGVLGGKEPLSFTATEQLFRTVTLEDQKRATYKPVSVDSLDALPKVFVLEASALFAKTMGPTGEHLNVMLFPANDSSGKRILNAAEKGEFFVNVGETRFRYRLPFGSVLPAKYDPQTGEQFPGNYDFSPFTGMRLDTKAPAGEK
jgi:hypothetical protein